MTAYKFIRANPGKWTVTEMTGPAATIQTGSRPERPGSATAPPSHPKTGNATPETGETRAKTAQARH